MQQRKLPLIRLVMVATFGLAWLPGCSGIGNLLGLAPQDRGCNPQVPVSAFRTQATTPMGTLVIRVLDANGVPQPGAGVMAVRLVNTGARCPSLIEGEADSNGVVRFERLKPGPYDIKIIGLQQDTTKSQIEDGKTTSVTLTKGA